MWAAVTRSLARPPEQRFERDPRLEPGQWRTQTEVDPSAEPQVVTRIPGDVEAVGIGVSTFVAVGAGEHDHDELVLAYLLFTKFDCRLGPPEQELHGRVIAQHLFDSGGDEVRFGAQ